MLPSLWLNNASSTPPELLIREGEQVLGRSADADICLDETFVSGYHARLNWNTTQLSVLDLDSTNGTLVNGVPVIGWTSLTDGDVIEFGGVEATVRLPMETDPTSIVGVNSHPPPPAPSRHRPELRPTDTDPTGTSFINDDPMIDLTTGNRNSTDSTLAASSQEGDQDPGDGSDTETNDDDNKSNMTRLGSLGSNTESMVRSEGRTFGTQLGPIVSDQTEPLFNEPLTSAVTLPPTPPAGLSVTDASHTGAYDDLDDSGFDFGDHGGGYSTDYDGDYGRQSSSSSFDRQGIKLTVGTAIVVFIGLVVMAALIIYFMQR